MKYLANENTGHMQFKKIKKKQHLACLSVLNLQFFFSPFYTHLCNKLEFLRVRIRAHDKNDLYSRACAKKAHGFILIIIIGIHERKDKRTGILPKMVVLGLINLLFKILGVKNLHNVRILQIRIDKHRLNIYLCMKYLN